MENTTLIYFINNNLIHGFKDLIISKCKLNSLVLTFFHKYRLHSKIKHHSQLKEGSDRWDVDRNDFSCKYRNPNSKASYEFLPAFIGRLNHTHRNFTYYDGNCINKTVFSIEYHPNYHNVESITVDIGHVWPLYHLCGVTLTIFNYLGYLYDCVIEFIPFLRSFFTFQQNYNFLQPQQ
jgi:hypothetical protein